MEAAGGRVLLEVPGVSLHPQLRPGPPRGEGLKGRLLVLQGPDDLILQWEPEEQLGDPQQEEEEEPPDPGYEPDWAVLSPPRPPPQPSGWAGGFALALGALRGLRRSPPGPLRPPPLPPLLLLLPRGGAPCPPPLRLPRGGARRLLRLLGPRLAPCPWDPGLLLVPAPGDPPPEPPPEPPPGIVTRLLQGPCAAVGLGRLLGAPRSHAPQGAGPGAGGAGPESEPPFEVIHCVTLGPRPTPARGPPITAQEWEEGRSLAPEVLRERIFRRGLSPEVRPQGWRLLLGLGGGDPQERERRDSYLRMRLQWRSLSPGQWSRNSPLRAARDRLEQDLAGAPPAAPPGRRALLRDLLLTYCMFHFDRGYVQGMGEVLSPLLSVAPGEVEAFWAFCSLMEMVGDSFGPEGLQRQLGDLGQLLRVLDPNLCELLELGGPRKCCCRWLQWRFDPPLGLEGTLSVWEALCSGLPCGRFLLLLCCVLLERLAAHGRPPPGPPPPAGPPPAAGPPLAGHPPPPPRQQQEEEEEEEWQLPPLGPQELLSRAEGLYLQLAAAPDLPPPIQELLGLGGPPPSPPPELLHPGAPPGDPPPRI